MTLWAFAFLIPAILCGFLAKFFLDRDKDFTGLSFVVIFVTLFIISIIVPVYEFDSVRKANFYNKNFGTHYTANDFFWNGEEIEGMLIGKKVRIDD